MEASAVQLIQWLVPCGWTGSSKQHVPTDTAPSIWRRGVLVVQGMYLEAFRRVFDILEDSGWQLVREGEEEELNSLADLPDLPYMKQV